MLSLQATAVITFRHARIHLHRAFRTSDKNRGYARILTKEYDAKMSGLPKFGKLDEWMISVIVSGVFA